MKPTKEQRLKAYPKLIAHANAVVKAFMPDERGRYGIALTQEQEAALDNLVGLLMDLGE